RRDVHQLVNGAQLRGAVQRGGAPRMARPGHHRLDRPDHRGDRSGVRAPHRRHAERVYDSGARAGAGRLLFPGPETLRTPGQKECVMAHAMFRPRRLREKPLLRALVRETALAVDDLVYPLFALHGRGVREPIASMPGQFRMSIDELVKEVKDAAGMGIPAVLLFGVPAEKDPRGSEAYAEDGIVQQAVRAVKDVVPDLLIVTDVCLCQYTSHGHCCIVEGGSIRNDPTLELLARVAVSQAEAGADMVARAKAEFGVPLAAYSVSGEYAMIRAAGRLGWLDEERAMLEALVAIRRAGADMVITYFAREAARLLERGSAR